MLWRFWIRLSTIISLLCSIAKVVSWFFRPKRIVIHACLWGKHLNELEKLMSWSLILLNLRYYNHSLATITVKLYIIYYRKQIWSYFYGTFSQSLPKETVKYHCVALSLSIPQTHFFRMIIL